MARSSLHDLREYRRGMVLGLTLAETSTINAFFASDGGSSAAYAIRGT